jgi:quinol monooxygenase YgiN
MYDGDSHADVHIEQILKKAFITMFTAIIQIHVKPEYINDFIQATLENASNSIEEVGIARFDLLHQQDDPTCFVLYEIYRSPDAQLAHRETAHYLKWRQTVEPMMAEPRIPTKYDVLFPAE